MIRSNRRQFMRAAAGLGLGAISYASMFRALEAEAAGTTKKRLILYVTGNGVGDSVWGGARRTDTDFDLPAPTTPLAPFRDKLTLVQGLGCPYSHGLHGNKYATLTMQPELGGDDDRPGGISFDRFAAGHLGAQDAFPSIALAYLYKVASKRFASCMSSDGPDQVFPAEWNPVKAHGNLFASLGDDPQALARAERALAQQRSVLDFTRRDSARLKARVGGYERAKIDQYETSLREMETRLITRFEQASGGACGGLPTPTQYDSMDAVIGTIHDDLVRMYVDMSLHAMLCGLTHVAHISIGGGFSGHSKYRFLGDTRGPHSLWHASKEANSIEMLTKIFRSDFDQIAYLWGELGKVPEGDGFMTDNTLILWINTGGRGHHRGYKNGHNVALLGDLGGALKTNQYLTFDKEQHTLADLYVSVAQALDIPINSFGAPESCKGPLPGLLV